MRSGLAQRPVRLAPQPESRQSPQPRLGGGGLPGPAARPEEGLGRHLLNQRTQTLGLGWLLRPVSDMTRLCALVLAVS